MKKPIIFRVEFIADKERRVKAFSTRLEAREFYMEIRKDPGVSSPVLLKVELLLKE